MGAFEARLLATRRDSTSANRQHAEEQAEMIFDVE
jgi:hypothetical protein